MLPVRCTQCNDSLKKYLSKQFTCTIRHCMKVSLHQTERQLKIMKTQNAKARLKTMQRVCLASLVSVLCIAAHSAAAANQSPHATGGYQKRADTLAAIPTGGTISQGVGVNIGATVTDPDAGDTIRIEVELRPLPATFTGTANYVSSYVSSGSVASLATITGLAAGSYGWRYRAVDSHGLATGWVPAGNPDFVVQAAPNQSPHATGGYQKRSDTEATIPAGGTIPQGVGVNIGATVTDPDAGDTIRIEVELHPVGTPFTGTANYLSGYVASGSVASISTITGLAPGSYAWQYRAVDNHGLPTNWVPPGNPDFVVDQPPNQSPHATGGYQHRADNGTTISPGATIPQGVGVDIGATVTDPDAGDTIRIEVELHPVGTPFTGTANYLSGYVASGSVASISTITGLAPGSYAWQYRAVDNHGLPTNWVLPGNPDFVVDQAPNQSPHATGGYQKRSDTGAAIAPGATIPQGIGVDIGATVTDPDAGDTIRIEVELHPVGTPFTGTANYLSGYVAGGSVASIATITGLAPGSYAWQYRAVDNHGLPTNWVPPGSPDFIVAGDQPVLSVSPANPPTQPATAGSINLNVNNTGSGAMNYSASVTSGASWLSITSGGSGGNSGTINVSYTINPGAQRSGTIQIVASGASGSPITITITQSRATGSQSLQFDRSIYFVQHEANFGSPSSSQRAGLNMLLGFIESDPALILDANFTHLRWAAYIMATTREETGYTYMPVEENGEGAGYPYGIPDPITGYAYYGRGYVQLTWKNNYILLGNVLGVDLVNNPTLALDPQIAYKVMSYGMRAGAFTGVGLDNYITDAATDYFNARRIVNGTDQAQSVADAAAKFEAILRASLVTPPAVPRLGGAGGGGLQPPSGGRFAIGVVGSESEQITMQFSDDLVTWTDMQTVTIVNGKAVVVDSNAGQHSRRFYRPKPPVAAIRDKLIKP